LGLLDDAFALCKAGHMSTPQLLDLLQSYVNENSFPVWASLTMNLEDLRSSWRQSLSGPQADEYALMQAYINKLYQPIVKDLGWTPKVPGEDRQQMLLRSVVLSYGGSHGLLKDVATEAIRQFHAHQSDQGEQIHPDLLTLVYNLAVKFGGEREWEAVREIYRNPKSQEQKIRATNALGKASDPALIRRTLNLALSDEMRTQDVYQVFASVGANDAGIEIVWSFLKDKWAELDEKFGDQFLMLGRIVETATAYFATEQRVNDLTEFFADKKTAGIDRKVQQCIERASSRSAWMRRDAQATLAWLRAFSNKPATLK
jgi:aminopeptidase 2